ncbi:hypothetical protein FRC03_003854 [Tulasnella sp. 419]|nr:hypothetical protein FRC03_003854 [Tulasnella sp. 419]
MTSSHQPIATDTLGGHQKLGHADRSAYQVQEHKSPFWEKVPLDKDEFARFEYQSRAIALTTGLLRDQADSIRSALAPDANRTPAVAEFSFISGSWAMEVAKEFPDVSVVGIDTMSSYNRSQTVPDNCRFEQHDLNLPLSKYHQAFDVCHINNMGKGIKDHEDLLYRIPETLRPNSVLLLTAAYSTFETEDKRPAQDDLNEGEPGWSALLAIWRESRKLQVKPGKPMEQQDQWDEILRNNPYFSSGGTRDIHIPIGPWENDLSEQAEEAAKVNQTNALQFVRTISHILLKDGFDEATINRWILIAREEIIHMKPRFYIRYRLGWAVRNEVEWTPKEYSKPDL